MKRLFIIKNVTINNFISKKVTLNKVKASRIFSISKLAIGVFAICTILTVNASELTATDISSNLPASNEVASNEIALDEVIHTEKMPSHLPQKDEKMHMGVASCAASMCHGSVSATEGSNILQNEYIIWSREDPHSQAYKTLLTQESQDIADKLGLGKATTAGVCLDCHSDNVPTEYQSKSFQISDGVGCESCHGGAENYLSSHTDSTQSHAENIAHGLYPTDEPQQRAKLCLSCHLGNEDKQATHDIMGAGHPRLAFELDTFGILQPLHYVVDEDYKSKKWSGDSYITWIYGQLEANKETLNILENKIVHNKGLFPELSLFDCYACHHPMSDLKWTETKGKGSKPGTVRLNDGNFKMLLAIAASTGFFTSVQENLNTLRNNLHNNVLLPIVVNKLFADIQAIEKVISKQSLSERKLSAALILTEILKTGSNDEFSDYIAAEQAVMAIDLLIVYIGDKAIYQQDIVDLFTIVNNDEQYNSTLFATKLLEIMNKMKINHQ
ncbi:multiheme c-type cytochrome [Colwellia echini]|uniref:multiheme c-type cytochrome n=1 Tax=Colwellia echini TaxID=1982103 RepID=UPI001478C128|nr:multiheme c-type cytochrome [Colwellia echini]